MKRVYYDFEFIEKQNWLDPISIGMVDDTDKQLDIFNIDCDLTRANDWVQENIVIPEVDDTRWRTREDFAKEILNFVGNQEVELWGYYSSYDHVCLMWLYGIMVNKPAQLPMRTHDIAQWADLIGVPLDDLPKPEKPHDSLYDAISIKAGWHYLWNKSQELANADE